MFPITGGSLDLPETLDVRHVPQKYQHLLYNVRLLPAQGGRNAFRHQVCQRLHRRFKKPEMALKVVVTLCGHCDLGVSQYFSMSPAGKKISRSIANLVCETQPRAQLQPNYPGFFHSPFFFFSSLNSTYLMAFRELSGASE